MITKSENEIKMDSVKKELPANEKKQATKAKDNTKIKGKTPTQGSLF